MLGEKRPRRHAYLDTSRAGFQALMMRVKSPRTVRVLPPQSNLGAALGLSFTASPAISGGGDGGFDVQFTVTGPMTGAAQTLNACNGDLCRLRVHYLEHYAGEPPAQLLRKLTSVMTRAPDIWNVVVASFSCVASLPAHPGFAMKLNRREHKKSCLPNQD